MDARFPWWLVVRPVVILLFLISCATQTLGENWAQKPEVNSKEEREGSPIEILEDPSQLQQRATNPYQESGYPALGSTPFNIIQINVDSNGFNIVGDAANEPSLAISPVSSERMVIGWRQFDTIASNFREAGWNYSQDGGLSWGVPGVIDPGVSRSDPVVTVDRSGRFYYLSLEVASVNVDIFRSTDGGLSWTSPYPTTPAGDKPWIAIDRVSPTGMGAGNTYLNWNTVVASGPNFARSITNPSNFSTLVSIPLNPRFGNIAIGASGQVYLAGQSNGGNPGDIVFSRSLNANDPNQTPIFESSLVDLGGDFAAFPPQMLPNPQGLVGTPWVAVDLSNGPRSGNIYLLCSVDPPGTDPLDVYFIRSEDQGETWSQPRRINDDPQGSGRWQWFGTMSVAPTGRIDVVWNDNRANPSANGNFTRTYFAYSLDGGDSWSDNIPFTEVWNSHLGWPQQQKIGDYYQTISDSEGVHVAFSATLNEEQDVFYTYIPVPLSPIAVAEGSRYIQVTPSPMSCPVRLLVTSPDQTCLSRYIQAPNAQGIAILGDSPVELTPQQWGTIHLTGPDIIPVTTYDIQAICGPSTSEPTSATTWTWGDTNNNNIVNLDDILCVLNAFASNPSSCPLQVADLIPQGVVNLDDILAVLSAFSNSNYSGEKPCS